MKYKVTYYDYDTDSTITKNCINIDPPRIYKSVIIDHPTVSICQNDRGLRITVDGYQCIKSGGYWKTKTIIESMNK
jgi:hypothetical protein